MWGRTSSAFLDRYLRLPSQSGPKAATSHFSQNNSPPTAPSPTIAVMRFFTNPFRTDDVSDFPGVLISLSEAHQQATIITDKKKKLLRSSRGSEGGSSYTTVSNFSKEHTLESLRSTVDVDIAAAGHDTAYNRKSKVVNLAIQDVGMGWYQWQLFVLCGSGWAADNLWLQGVALTLPLLVLEFGLSQTEVRYTACALFVGLCLGAVIWGTACDIMGRRLAFNCTLFLAGIFGLAAGGVSTWVQLCGILVSLGVGVGGNLPVDGVLFLEFLPTASGNLLTGLSVFWPIGQFVASLMAWGLVPKYCCDSNLLSCSVALEPCCRKANNMGWRYLVYTLGALTTIIFIARVFLFHLFESPKFLLSQGRQAEAVAVVHGLAYKNGKRTWLSEKILNEIGGYPEVVRDLHVSKKDIVKHQLEKFSTDRIKPLFANKRLGINTALVWFCWASIGMGYPLFNSFLPQYLLIAGEHQASTPTSIVYRNYAITSAVGVPGSLIALFMVDIPYVGRKGTMAAATLLTGIFLFLFTLSSDPNFELAFSCLEAFFQNIMYGVLYAYTPEVFPAPNRGTGTGIASFFNRICGLCAPIVAVNAGGLNPAVPIYVSGGLILSAFVAMCLLPIESRGKQAM